MLKPTHRRHSDSQGDSSESESSHPVAGSQASEAVTLNFKSYKVESIFQTVS